MRPDEIRCLAQVHGDLTKSARPQSDDPRPYEELLSRLGAYAPLTVLQWLAGHGCDADVELADADDLIRAYQDSPERAAMLASLVRIFNRLSRFISTSERRITQVPAADTSNMLTNGEW